MPATMYTSGQVATAVELPRHRLLYLIEAGHLPGPSITVSGRRLFAAEDVERIRAALIAKPVLREVRQRSGCAHGKCSG